MNSILDLNSNELSLVSGGTCPELNALGAAAVALMVAYPVTTAVVAVFTISCSVNYIKTAYSGTCNKHDDYYTCLFFNVALPGFASPLGIMFGAWLKSVSNDIRIKIKP